MESKKLIEVLLDMTKIMEKQNRITAWAWAAVSAIVGCYITILFKLFAIQNLLREVLQ